MKKIQCTSIIIMLLIVCLLMCCGCHESDADKLQFSYGMVTDDCKTFDANIHLQNNSWNELTDSEIKEIVKACISEAEVLALDKMGKNSSDETIYVINGINPDTGKTVFTYKKETSLISFGERKIEYER